MQRDSIGNVFRVTLLLCLACSLLVSAAAVGLRETQERNKKRERQRQILIAAGLFDPDKHSGGDVPKLFERVETQLINLETGEVVSKAKLPAGIPSIEDYDQQAAAADNDLSQVVPDTLDLARIRRRENYSSVYLIKNNQGTVQTIVLPIRGYGLWSTLRGYIALDRQSLRAGPEHLEIVGLTYYEHAETPGLGGEVDNPKWKALWPGKHIYDADWNVQFRIEKDARTEYEVDALSGATITSNGVENMMQYWFGDEGFKAYLKKLAGE
jgi:Na+-transporting NADH:ubiquinone oxidoreductase subunit C